MLYTGLPSVLPSMPPLKTYPWKDTLIKNLLVLGSNWYYIGMRDKTSGGNCWLWAE